MLTTILAAIPGTRAYRLKELRWFHKRVQVRRELLHLEREASRMPYGRYRTSEGGVAMSNRPRIDPADYCIDCGEYLDECRCEIEEECTCETSGRCFWCSDLIDDCECDAYLPDFPEDER